MSLINQIFLIASYFFGVLIVVGPLTILAILKDRQLRQKDKKAPIVQDLVMPGKPLWDALEKRADVLAEQFIGVSLASGLVGLGVVLITARIGSTILAVFIIIAGLVVSVAAIRRLWAELPAGRQCWQGLVAEQAAAQGISRTLMGENKLWFNLRSPMGDVDMVAVTKSGVFAIETKHVFKSTQPDGHKAVVQDGKLTLAGMPPNLGERFLSQARRNAAWLNKEFAARGLSIQVRPVLALPGWFVERAGACDVTVINPTNQVGIFLGKAVLSDTDIRRATDILNLLAEQGRNTEVVKAQ